MSRYPVKEPDAGGLHQRPQHPREPVVHPKEDIRKTIYDKYQRGLIIIPAFIRRHTKPEPVPADVMPCRLIKIQGLPIGQQRNGQLQKGQYQNKVNYLSATRHLVGRAHRAYLLSALYI